MKTLRLFIFIVSVSAILLSCEKVEIEDLKVEKSSKEITNVNPTNPPPPPPFPDSTHNPIGGVSLGMKTDSLVEVWIWFWPNLHLEDNPEYFLTWSGEEGERQTEYYDPDDVPVWSKQLFIRAGSDIHFSSPGVGYSFDGNVSITGNGKNILEEFVQNGWHFTGIEITY